MFVVVSLVVALLMPTALLACPGSPAYIHAKCEMKVVFSSACDAVQKEISARLSSPSWKDPHNGGTYSLTMTNSTALEGQRVTGDGKYTDKFDFNFSESGIETQSCTVEACSESQVNSVVDYSTNYCNLNNLYCSSKDGCAPINYDLDYKETYVACSQHDDVCKVTGLVVPPACSADIEKAVLAITQAGIDIADAVDDCADGFTDACNKDINSVLSDLTAATVDITAAVYDCGGTEPTQCSADIDAIIADLDTATIAITNAVIDCAVDPTKCTADIMKASQSIVQAGKDIAAATVDCA